MIYFSAAPGAGVRVMRFACGYCSKEFHFDSEVVSVISCLNIETAENFHGTI